MKSIKNNHFQSEPGMDHEVTQSSINMAMRTKYKGDWGRFTFPAQNEINIWWNCFGLHN